MAKDMSTFDSVRKRLNGCRPFAWYLKRFKAVYEDAGLIPPEIFMIREAWQLKGKSLCSGREWALPALHGFSRHQWSRN